MCHNKDKYKYKQQESHTKYECKQLYLDKKDNVALIIFNLQSLRIKIWGQCRIYNVRAGLFSLSRHNIILGSYLRSPSSSGQPSSFFIFQFVFVLSYFQMCGITTPLTGKPFLSSFLTARILRQTVLSSSPLFRFLIRCMMHL